MNRKPVFDAVRQMLGRGFTHAEVGMIDRALDAAEEPARQSGWDAVHRLGSLSEVYESAGRGPGTVSGGHNDPGGVSYGVYQLASKTGTCAAFVKAEGMPWVRELSQHEPGSPGFSLAWKGVAAKNSQAFRDAQHAFIERTHYRPAVKSVLDRTGLDLDSRSDAVRDVAWSCSVQHGGAARILVDAVDRADRLVSRTDTAYDHELIEAIYERRIEYVLGVAGGSKLAAGTRRQLVSITRSRYPKERAKALEMLAEWNEAAPYEVKGWVAAPRGMVEVSRCFVPLAVVRSASVEGRQS